jgi:transglutaminase-like putative cysteine protease
MNPVLRVFAVPVITCLAITCLGASVATAAEASLAGSLDPAAPYTAERANPVTYDVDYSVVVTPPYKTKKLRVWLPVPTSDAGQEVGSFEVTTFPAELKPAIAAEPLFGNRFAYFEFDAPQGAQLIRQRLKITVWELRWRLDSAKVAHVEAWPASFEPYRRSESQAVVVGEPHKKLIEQLLPKRGAELAELSQVMTHALRTFKYDHGAASLRADSLQAATTGRGHCSDYHSYCAAVGRALGYPTRVTYGINTFPKASPSHCKLEAFLPPYGWVSFDVSETQKLTGAIAADGSLAAADKERLSAAAERRLQSGFRDNTWYVQTRGTDYDLVPAASRRVPVVRTIYAEADGVPLDDPDPSDTSETKFAWMTVTRFTADKAVKYPFTDIQSLRD